MRRKLSMFANASNCYSKRKCSEWIRLAVPEPEQKFQSECLTEVIRNNNFSMIHFKKLFKAQKRTWCGKIAVSVLFRVFFFSSIIVVTILVTFQMKKCKFAQNLISYQTVPVLWWKFVKNNEKFKSLENGCCQKRFDASENVTSLTKLFWWSLTGHISGTNSRISC